MRERARDKGRLEDIIEYSTNVTKFIEGYSLEALIGVFACLFVTLRRFINDAIRKLKRRDDSYLENKWVNIWFFRKIDVPLSQKC